MGKRIFFSCTQQVDYFTRKAFSVLVHNKAISKYFHFHIFLEVVHAYINPLKSNGNYMSHLS
jgi:hypothetical protein